MSISKLNSRQITNLTHHLNLSIHPIRISPRPRLTFNLTTQLTFYLNFSNTTHQSKSNPPPPPPRDPNTQTGFGEGLDTSTWKSKSIKKWTPMTVVLVCVPLLTFGLGTWQVQRLKWKTNLIQDLDHKMRLDPITLPKSIKLSPLSIFIQNQTRSSFFFFPCFDFSYNTSPFFFIFFLTDDDLIGLDDGVG